jgi:hypothetical protein
MEQHSAGCGSNGHTRRSPVLAVLGALEIAFQPLLGSYQRQWLPVVVQR